MIKLLRIDERLLHGMVAISWTSYVSPDIIVVANDKAASDSFFSMTLKMAKPAGVDFRIYSLAEAADKLLNSSLKTKNVFLITESMEDAYILIRKLNNNNPVKQVNVGIAGVRDREHLQQIIPQLYLTPSDYEIIKKINEMNIDIYAQGVPTSKKASFNEISKIFE